MPAARLLPDCTYFPVFVFEFCELFAPVNVYVAFRLVNCVSLNTLYAWTCTLSPAFFRPMALTGNRRDSVRSHWCHVGLRRRRTGELPKLPMLPFGCGKTKAATL